MGGRQLLAAAPSLIHVVLCMHCTLACSPFATRTRLLNASQAFSCWIHLCVVRLFVESILRYGLPPQFQAVAVRPHARMEARLRAVLAGAFGTGAYGRAQAGCGWHCMHVPSGIDMLYVPADSTSQ